MNEQTHQLIEALAAKLGTTVEYLWAVLINQAAVYAVTQTVLFLACVIYLVVFIRFVVKWIKEDDEYLFDATITIRGTAWIVGSILAFFALVGVLFLPYDIITAFFNPEYWALKEILKAI